MLTTIYTTPDMESHDDEDLPPRRNRQFRTLEERDPSYERRRTDYDVQIESYVETLTDDKYAVATRLYEYARIQENQIRVLDLRLSLARLHYDGRKTLSGSLRTITLNHAATDQLGEGYEALSYAWGPTYEDGSHLSHFFYCDSSKLRVTAHLYRALIHLLEATANNATPYRLTIWIDAICIDQSNFQERAAQVAKMDQIFGQATKITVWLGEASAGDLGRRELSFLCSIRQDGGSELEPFFSVQADEIVESDLGQRLAAEKARSNRPVMEALIARSWFKRRWVIQEVLAARKNEWTIRVGGQWCRYREFYDQLRYSDLRLQAGPMTLRTRPLTLLQNLHLYDQSECSDSLDRIFALRNLATDGKAVAVDYGHDVRHTYLHVSMTIALGTAYDPTHRGLLPCPNVIPLELLRLLVLASCKKRRWIDDRAVAEAWAPDFRLRNRFTHDEHERAVTLAMSPSSMLHPDRAALHLPDAVDVDEAGHCYLRVSPSMEDPSAAREGNGTHIPTAEEVSLIVWLPWRQVDARGQSRRETGIGFFLDPGQTRTSYKGHPVYRLYSCFRLPTFWTAPEEPCNLASGPRDVTQRPPMQFLGEETFFIE